MSEYTTVSEYEASRPEPSTFPGAGSYIVAVLFPVVGVILGVVALGKSRVGPGLAVLATSALSFFVWLYVLALSA